MGVLLNASRRSINLSAGVRFGSQVNQISGLKSAWCKSGLCLTLLLCNCCYKQSLRNNPHNQTNIFRLNVTLTTPRSIMPTYSYTVVFFATKFVNRISHIIEWIIFMESRQVGSMVKSI